ncbi:MAG: G5 domain-containing protein [Clostridia bacterium]|nr:G5 domain-containing protein [Clostridia bacterium]
MALRTVLTILLSISFIAASVAGAGYARSSLDVGFEPQYQTGGSHYSSTGRLIGDYADAVKVNFKLHGTQEISVYTSKSTVGEVIDNLSLSIAENDVVDCDLSTPVADGMTVSVNRLDVKTRDEISTVPFETVVKKTSDLSSGTTKVSQQGKDGTLKKTYKETYVNGVLAESVLESETYTVKPQNKIVLQGTYVETRAAESTASAVKDVAALAPQTTAAQTTAPKTQTAAPQSTTAPQTTAPSSSSGGYETEVGGTSGGVYVNAKGESVEYAYYIDVKATAYSYEAGTITATGKYPVFGMFAADPKVIPYHTKCYIVGNYGDYGYQVMEDCGGNIKGNRIDIFMPSEADCRAFGVRQMRVYILK